MRPGSHIETLGTKVTSIKVIKVAIIQGIVALKTSSMGIPDMELATKRLMPTGGVMSPSSILTTIMIAKCTGFMPSDSAVGDEEGGEDKYGRDPFEEKTHDNEKNVHAEQKNNRGQI